MKKLCLSLALAASLPQAWASPDLGVSIGVSQPGFYGQIDIGRVSAPPVLVYPQPVIIAQPRGMVQPVYLHVPPGHAKDWRKHCKHYGACARPVYFVKEDWYQRYYVVAPAKGHGKRHGKGRED